MEVATLRELTEFFFRSLVKISKYLNLVKGWLRCWINRIIFHEHPNWNVLWSRWTQMISWGKQTKYNGRLLSSFSFPLFTPTEGSPSSYAHYVTYKFLRHFVQTWCWFCIDVECTPWLLTKHPWLWIYLRN